MPAVPAIWKALCGCAVHHRPGPHLLHWPGGVPWAVFVPRIAFTCWESGALHWTAELGRHPTTSEWEARLMMTFVPWLMRRLKFWGKLSSVRSFPPQKITGAVITSTRTQSRRSVTYCRSPVRKTEAIWNSWREIEFEVNLVISALVSL